VSDEPDAVDDLAELLDSAGARVTFDRGRNSGHPCTFCAKPGKSAHRLRNIGRYPNGTRITRPVCENCSSLADAIEGSGAREPATLDGAELAPGDTPSVLDLESLQRVVRELATQDNAATSHPFFVVQRRERFYGVDMDHGSNESGTELGEERSWCWIEDSVLIDKHSDPERFAELESQLDSPPELAERVGRVEFWQTDQVFLTRQAAEEYASSQAHNLGRTRIWTGSAYRNQEWRWLRSLLPLVAAEIYLLRWNLREARQQYEAARADANSGTLERMLFSSRQTVRDLIARIDHDGGHKQKLDPSLSHSIARAHEEVMRLFGESDRVKVLEDRLSIYECVQCGEVIDLCDCANNHPVSDGYDALRSSGAASALEMLLLVYRERFAPADDADGRGVSYRVHGDVWEKVREALRLLGYYTKTGNKKMAQEKCPSCQSHAPHLHPAVQHEGEVTLCRDEFHLRVTPENTPERIASVNALRTKS
jgi:hypothetical protein